MKKLLSLTLASLMLLSAVACGKTEPAALSVTSSAEQFLTERLGAVPDDVILGDADVAASYGVDMTAFEDEGYIVRTVGDDTLVFGKTEDGLDRAVRYYANYVANTDTPADKVYGEGERIDSLTVCGRPIGDYVITVTEEHPEGAYPESTAYAATELVSVIKQASGVTVPVVKESELAEGTPYIRLTCDGSGDNGEEGFTVTVTDAGNIEVLGGLKRGCLYAVYDIAEKWLGMRFVTSSYTYIYEADAVHITTEDSYSDAPKMKLRYPYNYSVNPGLSGFAQNADFAARNKLNGNTGAARYGYTPVVTANHGLYKYWETGAHADNPCFNSEAMYDRIIENLTTELENAKKSGALYAGNYYHVNLGQNDNNIFCQCRICLDVTQEEGSYSGNLVRLVKNIADYFAEDYPEAVFGILAYWGTERPCKVTKLPDNVAVTYCITGACYGGPMDGSECRPDRTGLSTYTAEGERENILGWGNVTNNLKLWIYYFSENISTPNNVIRHLYKDITYLYSIGVREMFIEMEHTTFSYDIPGGWLLSKLLWDPEMSEEEFNALRDEIMWLTYGDGYEYILDQLDVYDSLFLCSDRTTWGADLDWKKVAEESEYFLLMFGEAQRLADSAYTEKNVRLISAHAKYNALCAWYEDRYVNGTEEDRAYMKELTADLKGILEDSGATYIDFWRVDVIADIDFESDPKTWVTPS